jgi:hypothetical protein
MDRPSNSGRPLDPLALVRIPGKTADIAAVAKMPRPALALLAGTQTPRQYLDALLKAGMFADAIRFLAFALPVREAVWWGCLCLRLTHADPEQSVNLAARWVIEPTEAHRQEAEKVANQTTAAGWLARAVAWTGGSLLPPSQPVLKPRPELPHQAVLASLSLALHAVAPDKVEQTHRHALVMGIHVARGNHLWPAPGRPVPERRSSTGFGPRPRVS